MPWIERIVEPSGRPTELTGNLGGVSMDGCGKRRVGAAVAAGVCALSVMALRRNTSGAGPGDFHVGRL